MQLMHIRQRTRAQLLMIYKISTYLCPKDERESLKRLNMSPSIHKSLFTIYSIIKMKVL